MPDNIEDRSEIPSDAKEIVTTNEIEATDSERTTNVDNELRQDESNEQTGDDSNDNLASKRQLINDLLHNDHFEEGTERYIIPQNFLHEFLNLPIDNFSDLKDQLGPIDFHSLLNEQGNLYPRMKNQSLFVMYRQKYFNIWVNGLEYWANQLLELLLLIQTPKKNRLKDSRHYFGFIN